MSLVGNLEDLSLGDILQIISLSQKSGVLALQSEEGSGRIVFRSGLVFAACVKGAPNDLRDLLVGRGLIDPAGFDAARARAADHGTSLEEALGIEADLPPDQIERFKRESAEASILDMFTWLAGDFSFDVRTDLEPDDPQLVLANGVNAQYLAMEGLRLRDERMRDVEPEVDPNAETNPGLAESDDIGLFGAEPLETDPPELVAQADLLDTRELEAAVLVDDPAAPAAPVAPVAAPPPPAEPVAATEEPPRAPEPTPVTEQPPAAVEADAQSGIPPEPTDATATSSGAPPPESAATLPPRREAATHRVARRAVEQTDPVPVESPAPAATAASAPNLKMPVVLIDPDVSVLEWVKAAIEADFARVHVFQQAEQGLARIRQYLIRGESPLVLISPETEIDPLSGIHGIGDFVKRLKTQAPKLIVLGLREDEDGAPCAMPARLNGVLRRPSRRELAERATADKNEIEVAAKVLSSALCEIVTQQWAGNRATVPSKQAESLRGLKEATGKLEEASSRGEVLPVVLDFAAESFARVAVLIVREEAVFAIAGRGIPALEVDPLDPSPPITLPACEAGWIRRVLDTGTSLVGPPRTEADVDLLARFGEERPPISYLGPIVSGDSVIALLYGDQGPSDRPIPDTSGLEVVLKHAGLALDRAALERALWEVDGETY